MIDGFARLVLEVPNLDSAIEVYQQLLGPCFRHTETEAVWPLANIAVVMKAGAPEAACIVELGLWSIAGHLLPDECRGLSVSHYPERSVDPAPAGPIQAVDHIVLQTGDADDCIRLFGADLGMRLALDQHVPEWGGRMLFFRCGKLTLEVIHNIEQPVAQDVFWGISYLCSDLDQTLSRLDANGVAHSGARQGRKPGTRVATIKSHTLGIPTLVVEPAQ